MDQEIERIFEEINNDYEPISIGGMTELGDHLEYGEWDEESYKEVLKRLLDIYFNKKTSLNHQRAVHRTISNLILYSAFEFSFDDFKPMISVLEKGTDYPNMDAVLHLFTFSSDLKFLPLIEKFIDHPDENVRKQAIETLDRLKEINGLK